MISTNKQVEDQIDQMIGKKFFAVVKQQPQKPYYPSPSPTRSHSRCYTKEYETRNSANVSPHKTLLDNIENYSTTFSSEVKFTFVITKTMMQDKFMIRFNSHGHSTDVFTCAGEMKTITLYNNQNSIRESSPLSPDPTSVRSYLNDFIEKISPIKPNGFLPSTPNFSKNQSLENSLNNNNHNGDDNNTQRPKFDFERVRPRTVNEVHVSKSRASVSPTRDVKLAIATEINELAAKHRNRTANIIDEELDKFEGLLKGFSCELFAMDQKMELPNSNMILKMLEFVQCKEDSTHKQMITMIRDICLYSKDLLESCFEIAPFHSFGFEKAFKFMLYLFEVAQQRHQTVLSKLELELEE